MAAASVRKRADVVAALNPQSSALGCKTRNHNKAVWHLVLYSMMCAGKEVMELQIKIEEIKVNPDRGEVVAADVEELADSIKELGLLTAITVDSEYNLIAGLHRLEAVKSLGWKSIECVVVDLTGLQAELAEIDENFIRRNIPTVEYGELLLRRKQIYETLHPETKNGGDRKSEIRRAKCASDPVKSFVQDTAERLGIHESTVRREIQVAKNLTDEAKSILSGSDVAINKKTAMQLSRLKPEKQKEVATLLAQGEIKTVDEFYEREDEQTPVNPIHSEPLIVPLPEEGRQFTSFEEAVADLKNPNKDTSCTPVSFLMEVTGFVERYLEAVACCHMEQYEEVYSALSNEQMDYLRKQMDRVYNASEELYQTVEGKRNDELQKTETPA